MKLKNKITLEMLKYKVLELRKRKQIPFRLAYHVQLLTKDSDVEWITILKNLCEQMMRVSGFYEKFPQQEREANNIVDFAYQEYLKRS